MDSASSGCTAASRKHRQDARLYSWIYPTWLFTSLSRAAEGVCRGRYPPIVWESSYKHLARLWRRWTRAFCMKPTLASWLQRAGDSGIYFQYSIPSTLSLVSYATIVCERVVRGDPGRSAVSLIPPGRGRWQPRRDPGSSSDF